MYKYNPIEDHFEAAATRVENAVDELGYLRTLYERSDLPDRKARIRSIDSKIDALRGVKLDASAYPWSEDTL